MNVKLGRLRPTCLYEEMGVVPAKTLRCLRQIVINTDFLARRSVLSKAQSSGLSLSFGPGPLLLGQEISSVLSRHNLDVQNLRRQGYDGASNMRGEWNRLQALFLKDCLFAYYVHCLTHRLQLALVSAAKEVCYIHKFFSKLTLIVNVVTVSPKHHDQLRVAQANNVANLIADDQLVTGSGLNQIGTLQRIGDTRWGSHLNSVRSLLCMFDATYEVLEKSTEEGNFSNHGDASAAYDAITSFEFVFVLHLMRNILELYLLLVLVDDDFVYEMLLWLLKIDLMNKNLRYVVIDEMLKNGCTYDMKLRYIELRVLGQLCTNFETL
ncbi:Zinc finger MYM-type protein [Arachis hypogaea]|nr:Zinc finger MYM-type protein [Arachis hypogaea]